MLTSKIIGLKKPQLLDSLGKIDVKNDEVIVKKVSSDDHSVTLSFSSGEDSFVVIIEVRDYEFDLSITTKEDIAPIVKSAIPFLEKLLVKTLEQKFS